MAQKGICGGSERNSMLAAWYCIVFPYATIYTRCVYNLYTWLAEKSMPKEKIINFRIDAELKNRAKKLAESDGRSLSNWITHLIEREVKRTRKKG